MPNSKPHKLPSVPALKKRVRRILGNKDLCMRSDGDSYYLVLRYSTTVQEGPLSFSGVLRYCGLTAEAEALEAAHAEKFK